MRRVIGLMSGTSLDGLDVCLAAFRHGPEGLQATVEAFRTYPYPVELRERVERLLGAGSVSLVELGRLDVALGSWFAGGVERFLEETGVPRETIDAIASHGQTLWHAPEGAEPFTMQLGEGAEIAVRTGITTVHDFRVADVAAGGQGAPLVPAADRALFADPGHTVALLNLGGMANVTVLGPGGVDLLAFDTGPGIVALDQVWRDRSGSEEPFDRGGLRALAGRVDPGLLEAWMAAEPFLLQPPPRSTGRERFGRAWARDRAHEADERGLSLEDTLATLSAFTAEAVIRSLRRFVGPDRWPARLWVAGGGVHHAALMQHLSAGLEGVAVASLAASGIDPDAREALAFAWLGHQVLEGEANQAMAGTGAKLPVLLGKVSPGRDFGGIRRAAWSAQAGERITEALHPGLEDLACASIEDAIVSSAREDERALAALRRAAPALAGLVRAADVALSRGGRIVYVGAGTSGRLGVLDAVECPPTFSVDPGRVVGILAGGTAALTGAVEGAEDDPEAGAREMDRISVGPADCVVGLAASGRTPFVHGALARARELGATTGLIGCNPGLPTDRVDHLVELVVGPEVIAGSTRLRAGTVTKLALNLLSTLAWARQGKTHANRMVDVKATNRKLRERALRLVMDLSASEEDDARQALLEAGGEVKVAIVMRVAAVDAAAARHLLEQAGGRLGHLIG
jgi:N-acetylmuramic acid 6-phosphate etherase